MNLQQIAALGWYLVPIVAGSKNPGSIVGADWPGKCTNNPDEVATWPDDVNAGLLLGPKSGVMDLEFDSDTGEMLIDSWLEDCGGVITPSYRSAKSVHRLFRWDDRFENEPAKFGGMGVEFRFGQDVAQSVIPPSTHESGAAYQWLDGLSPADCAPVALPDLLFKQYLNLRSTIEKTVAKAARVDPRYTTGDTLLSKARNYVETSNSWESILLADGWKFCRNRGEAQDWWRPGKTRGSISGTVNFGGSKTLRVFSTSIQGLQADSSYDKFAYLCATKFSDDPVKAAFGLCPETVLNEKKNLPVVDLSMILSPGRGEDIDDEQFCCDMVPKSGLLRGVFDYYCQTSHRTSCVMGLATAVAFCEMLFGRRIRSDTDMRTNDFNVVMAPTSSGKEACEKTITRILEAASVQRLIPPEVQSGNGLLKAINENPCCIWVCDEFGKVIESVLNEKSSNGHARTIGRHLLSLYTKSDSLFGGAAHADGLRNATQQPHLVILGMSTGRIFEAMNAKQIEEGLFGRLTFWAIQTRPRKKYAKAVPVPGWLAKLTREWCDFEPVSGNMGIPDPKIIEMSPNAFARYQKHDSDIDDKMESESESRAAIWGRVSGRTMKLALVHRAARIESDPKAIPWTETRIEIEDMEWAIRLNNWLANVVCGLIKETVTDTQATKARHVILSAVMAFGEIYRTKLLREFRTIVASEFTAAAAALESEGLIQVVHESTGRRPKILYKTSRKEVGN